MVGIDFSMSSAGIVIGASDKPDELEFACFRQRKKDEALAPNITILEQPEWGSDEERYYKIAHAIVDYIKSKTDEKIVFIEDYSYGSKGNTFNIGEATGALKQLLWLEGYEVYKLAPTQIKKFATGKGNANKTAMYDHFVDKTNYDFNKTFYGPMHIEKGDKKIPSPISDIVDAYFILQYGIDSFH